MVRRKHSAMVKQMNSRVKHSWFISHLFPCMCPVSSPVHVVFHTIAMRIKLIDSCKVFKTVPGSVPIIFNEFKDILLRTTQVRDSTITQKEKK